MDNAKDNSQQVRGQNAPSDNGQPETNASIGFEWINIYKKIAEMFADEENGKTFIQDILDGKGLLTDSFKCDNNTRDNVDPFSFFALFNFNENKRKKILKVILDKINEDKAENNKLKMPSQFNGIPHIRASHLNFPSMANAAANTDAENNTNKFEIIQRLWNLCIAAINYNVNNDNNQTFIDAFDNVKKQYGKGWFTTTSILFEMRPDVFLPLDTNTRAYLKGKISEIENWPAETGTMTKSGKMKTVSYSAVLDGTAPTAIQYLAILKAVSQNQDIIADLKSDGCEFSSDELFAQISQKAWTKSDMGQVFELLKKNGQVILHGAPGTGKTFLAEKTIAPLLATPDEPGVKIKHIRKVQFHPGYDYSDFIVGMKPMLVSEKRGNEVIRRNGRLFELIPKTASGQDDQGSSAAEYEEEPFTGKVQQSFRWQDGIFKQIADEAKQALENNPTDPEKFVLIIDEINRADLSNVFGEVFSCIERGYRYRYHFNSDSGKYEFENTEGIMLPNGEQLVVPENLYIIGTMNDIDRSVESIDFALRRRFAWKEISAKETQDSILAEFENKDFEKLEKKMNAVNDIIKETLDSSHELGAAYFANLKLYRQDTGNYTSASYDSLWANHLEPILKEYLRGEEDAETTLTKMKNAYEKNEF